MTYDATAPYPRDLVGYGRNPPHPQWPGQARVALQFVLNYEEGGENAVLHGDGGSEQFLSEMFNPPSFTERHMSMEGIYEYGSRVGVWRILREFEKRGLPLTVFGVGMALQRHPELTAAFVELGGILSELERPADAAKAYQRAIDLDAAKGQPAWTHIFLKASALDRAGDWQGAKALLLQANQLDPSQAVILNYLGYGMLDRGENLAEAQVYIEKASALDPNDAAIADSLGWLQYKRGNYARAIIALERAVAGDPGQSVMNEHLGDAYWASGRRIEARYAWRAALVQADKPGTERINHKLSDGLGDIVSAK